MTIKSEQISSMAKMGGEYIGTTQIWNIHKGDLRSRNLAAFLKKIEGDFPEKTKLMVLVGKKGRSAHSASDLHVYRYSTKKFSKELEMANNSNSNLWDCYIKINGIFS